MPGSEPEMRRARQRVQGGLVSWRGSWGPLVSRLFIMLFIDL